MISAQDVENWKHDPVTKKYFESCEDRIEEAKAILCSSAGLDPVNDNFYRGFIRAYEEKHDFQFETEEE